MGEENNLEPGRKEPNPAPAGDAQDVVESEAGADAEAKAASTPSADAKGLTPGQRLAAKKAQKAQKKREFKDDLKRQEEEEREKDVAEAQRILRPAPAAGLPDEVQKVAGEFSDYVETNRSRIVLGIGAVVVIAIGVILAQRYMGAGSAEQAKLLSTAVETAEADVDADNTEGKREDGKPVFKTREDRAQKAVEAFSTAIKNRPDSTAATWGRLGQAAVELGVGKASEARVLYQQVYDAYKTDKVIGVRALEGLSIALESEGKADEALKRYEELKGLDKDLGEYHLARLKLAKGDREGAKTMLKTLYDRLSERAEGAPPSRFLKGEVEVRLSEIDASLVDKGKSAGDGEQFSQEELQRLIEQLRQKGGLPAENGSE